MTGERIPVRDLTSVNNFHSQQIPWHGIKSLSPLSPLDRVSYRNLLNILRFPHI